MTRFFGLTFVLSWVLFGAAVPLANAGHGGSAAALVLVGAFVPAIVALTLTAMDEGRESAGELAARLLVWRVDARWYVFAASYMVAAKLAVAVTHRVMLGRWPAFGTEPWFVIVGAIVMGVVIPGTAGEEIGWRGYALPRLIDRVGPAVASVALGVMWALWHLPLFFLQGSDKLGQSFMVYALQLTAFSVAMTWMFLHTRGSLLLAVLMHTSINQTKDIVPSVVAGATSETYAGASLVAWLTLAFLWMPALYFLARMRDAANPVTTPSASAPTAINPR